ncbi:lipoprotein [Spiroplasma endosymbiont of Cantharis rufa]|uniref:lipoprotein n=1 Tax=Spiroplasma endosymbiont of Cantharis rufa TaxID=3066279 RepID=UPI0030CAD3AF
MKKLLNILASATLIGSTATSAIACGNGGGPKPPVDPEIPVDPEKNNLQEEMLRGAEFISRLIVGGRHENLNYNINEILSIFLTPTPTALNMPTSYKYNNQSINMSTNISRFKNYLAPSLNYYNGDNYAGMYASYIMGMYENSFYNTMINGDDNDINYFKDTFSKSGNQGYNKSDNNAMGYAAGLGKNINLSKDEQRKNLAWGIQDTGALSNYLLNLGFDGANPTDTNGTTSPKTSAKEKTGTNGGGYAWYNSILMNNGAKKSTDYNEGSIIKTGIPLTKGKLQGTDFKKADNELKSSIKGIYFNSTGALITKVAGEQNINGFISLFASMLENISDTKNGALILSEFMNILFPLITDGSFMSTQSIMQKVGMSLITGVWDGIKKIDNSLIYDDEDLLNKISELDKVPGSGILDTVKLSNFYAVAKRDKDEQGTNAKDIIYIIEELIKLYEKSENKVDFNEKFFIKQNSPFYKAYESIMQYIGTDNWNKSIIGENNDGGINLLNFAKGAYSMMIDRETIYKFETIIEEFKNEKSFRDLTNVQKNRYLDLIGWSEDGYKKGELGARMYNAFTNKEVIGQKDFSDFFAGFKDYVSNAMGKVHEPVLKYLVDDKYWKVNDFTINTTSNTQKAGKMEFTLDYTGNGDVTSNASQQTKKVEVGNKFNPYQTIANYQSDIINELGDILDPEKIKNSGKILGLQQGVIKEENLVNYDGLGNYQDYEPVKNSYKIVWENISNNENSPYWIITSIRSFNANGQEFYNIY